ETQISACTRAIASGQESISQAVSYYYRGLAYKAKGEIDLAIADFDAAIRLDPEHERARREIAMLANGRPGPAAASPPHGDAIIGPADDATNCILASVETQTSACTRVITFGPGDASVQGNISQSVSYYYRGLAYKAKGNIDLAIADFDAA